MIKTDRQKFEILEAEKIFVGVNYELMESKSIGVTFLFFLLSLLLMKNASPLRFFSLLLVLLLLTLVPVVLSQEATEAAETETPCQAECDEKLATATQGIEEETVELKVRLAEVRGFNTKLLREEKRAFIEESLQLAEKLDELQRSVEAQENKIKESHEAFTVEEEAIKNLERAAEEATKAATAVLASSSSMESKLQTLQEELVATQNAIKTEQGRPLASRLGEIHGKWFRRIFRIGRRKKEKEANN